MNLWSIIKQWLAPDPLCVLCDAPARRLNLCRACRRLLPFIGRGCPRCGAPGSAAPCRYCVDTGVPWSAAAAALD